MGQCSMHVFLYGTCCSAATNATRQKAPACLLLRRAGLGTSTAKEAKEYFANMDQHKKNFVWEGEWVGAAR